jgi:hypothetical protein
VIGLIVGALIAVAAVVIVSLPFLRETGEPELLDRPGTDEIVTLMEARDHVLAALKELEFDHRIGNIDDVDYRASVGPLRREAAAALQAIDRYKAKASAEEELSQQEDVQADDHDGDPAGGNGGEAAVDEGAHHVTAGGKPDERDQRERDPEGQHDL